MRSESSEAALHQLPKTFGNCCEVHATPLQRIKVLQHFLFTFLAPSAPPENVTAYNLSSTSVMVTWFPVPDDMLNGILQSYRVVYREAFSVNSAQLEIEVANTSLSVIITSLKKFTVYSVWVKAVTVAEGPSSAVVNVSTDEDGKVVLFIIAFFLFEDLKPSLCE